MLVFCLLIAVPACILIGKAHVFFSRKIRNEFGICPVIYYITAMGLPVLMWVGGAVVGLAFPELLTFGTVNFPYPRAMQDLQGLSLFSALH